MSNQTFLVGTAVRYHPGRGYGYEDMIGSDGRVPGVVVGHSPTRVRVHLTSPRTTRTVTRTVDASSLQRADGAL